jgi:hypothetical protein
MDWTAPVSTALGALIGLGSSFLVDRHRWRREQELLQRNDLRSAYAAFLQATAETSEILWHVSRGYDSDETAHARVRTVLRDSGVFSRQYELLLVANDDMAESTNHLIKLLIGYRDAVVQGLPYDNEETIRRRKEFRRERERLIQVMRETL